MIRLIILIDIRKIDMLDSLRWNKVWYTERVHFKQNKYLILLRTSLLKRSSTWLTQLGQIWNHHQSNGYPCYISDLRWSLTALDYNQSLVINQHYSKRVNGLGCLFKKICPLSYIHRSKHIADHGIAFSAALPSDGRVVLVPYNARVTPNICTLLF